MLVPHPLVFTVRAKTCVYSDSLHWVIGFTPHFTLKYSKNHGHVNYIICSRYQIVKRLCVFLLSKHTHILFWTGPTDCNLVNLEGPEIDFDRPRGRLKRIIYTIKLERTGTHTQTKKDVCNLLESL